MKKKSVAKNSLLAISQPLRWGLIVVVVLALILVSLIFGISPVLGLLVFIIFTLIVAIGSYLLRKFVVQTNKYLYDLSFRENRGKQEALINIPIGMLLYDNDKQRTIEWVNPNLQRHFVDKDLLGRSLNQVNPELIQLVEKNEQQQQAATLLTIGQTQFQTFVQPNFRVIYFLDVTQYVAIKQKYEDEKISIGQVFIDNYDELVQTMADRDRSDLNSYLTNQLTDWANQNEMYLKRVASDRFIVVGYVNALKALEANSFSILDQIRKTTSQQNVPLTLSIGFAYGKDNLAQLALDAQKNIDLALGRGGDQAVVREADEPARFYGGNTNPMEKRTRVRARMISQALRELFNQVDVIYVMGHQQPDMDSLGACLGIHRIAQMNNKTCKIVIDANGAHTDVARLLQWIEQDQHLSNDLITPQQALDQANAQSMLIMVDLSKPSRSASPELAAKLADQTVVIDHHRRGEEFPANPLLAYIEPYASSASELVTEMIEYQPQSQQSLSKLEATAMLAGIFVDTHSFSLRSGTRTFDAASYLRSVGADSTKMQNLLKENVSSYIQRNHLIDTVQMVTPQIAICTGEEDQVYDSVIAAQAADTLLTLSKIDASFVITKRSDAKVAISARSLGDFNVQVIMEEMGGGGHLSNAATQLADYTIAQAKKELIAIIQQKVEDKPKQADNN